MTKFLTFALIVGFFSWPSINTARAMDGAGEVAFQGIIKTALAVLLIVVLFKVAAWVIRKIAKGIWFVFTGSFRELFRRRNAPTSTVARPAPLLSAPTDPEPAPAAAVWEGDEWDNQPTVLIPVVG